MASIWLGALCFPVPIFMIAYSLWSWEEEATGEPMPFFTDTDIHLFIIGQCVDLRVCSYLVELNKDV